MRDRMERFVLLHFSVGCVSESSIAVAVQHHQQSRRSKQPADHKNTFTTRNREEDESLSSNESMKSSFRFPAISNPDISTGFHSLFKSFKSFSQLFVYKEEIEEEIEIGFPTDVKHVTHIGIDCSATTNHINQIKGWEDLTTSELISLSQFEQLSTAAQA